MRRGIATFFGLTTSVDVNSRVASGFLSLASVPKLLAPDSTWSAPPATITAATPPISHSFRMGLPFLLQIKPASVSSRRRAAIALRRTAQSGVPGAASGDALQQPAVRRGGRAARRQ